jgi:hypothetical protein
MVLFLNSYVKVFLAPKIAVVASRLFFVWQSGLAQSGGTELLCLPACPQKLRVLQTESLKWRPKNSCNYLSTSMTNKAILLSLLGAVNDTPVLEVLPFYGFYAPLGNIKFKNSAHRVSLRFFLNGAFFDDLKAHNIFLNCQICAII